MGAWGTEIFEDDTALDCLADLMESSTQKYITSAFEEAAKSEYLEYTECFEALISAVVLDSILNDTFYDIEDDELEYEAWIKNLRKNKFQWNSLTSRAVKALQIVISDKSELNELWAENEEDYPSWRKNIENLIYRLSK